jgi:hypothetical protein
MRISIIDNGGRLRGKLWRMERVLMLARIGPDGDVDIMMRYGRGEDTWFAHGYR